MPVADLGEISLYYQDRGDGPAVVGIMGFALDQRFWAGQRPTITERHRFITFDNRGVGRSCRIPATTIDEMADDTIRLLDHLGIDRTVVFGVSMGGAVAQRLALDNEDRVSGLILAVTWARPIEFMRRQHAVARRLIESGGSDALVEAALLWMFTPRFFEVGHEVIDRLVASLYAPSGPHPADEAVLLAQLDAIDKHDVMAELPTLKCPTLVVGGKHDMMVPCFASEEIAAAIPGAELATFESGHGLMIEEMDAVNRRIAEFLANL